MQKRLVTILVVEDNDLMRQGITELLQIVDFNNYEITVVTACNGVEGLQVLSEHNPDLIISDIAMPKMGGLEFIRNVRGNQKWVHIPFILLTARTTPQDIFTGRLSGAELYITKPFDADLLIEYIKTQLDRTFQLRQTRQQEMETLQTSILQLLNHEFRTPLTYIVAYYEMLAQSVDKDVNDINLPQYLFGIQSGCKRLTRLVKNFIQLLDLQSGKIQKYIIQNIKPLNDIEPILHKVISTSEANVIGRQDVVVHLNIPENLPSIYINLEYFQIALVHFVDNAIKFTQSHLTGGNVTINAEVIESKVHIIIQDEGVGFPKHVNSRIFELFFQYNREYFEQQGVGIGLTIANELIQLQGGSVAVESQIDKGSTFTLAFPTDQLTEQVENHEYPLTTKPISVEILIVEDHEDLREGLKDILEFAQGKYIFQISLAEDGKEALEKISHIQPDLIISDISMPVMGGYEFMARVRQDPEKTHIPFIFLTALGENVDKQRGWLSGVDEYITKPYDIDELQKLIYKQLDRYFVLQEVADQTFAVLKQKILNLIPDKLQHPLSSVALNLDQFTEAMDQAKTDDAVRVLLKDVQENSRDLSTQVEDFIKLVELNTGEALSHHDQYQQQIHDPIWIIQNAITLVKKRGGRKNAPKIEHDFEQNLPSIQGTQSTLVDIVQRLICIGRAHSLENDKPGSVYIKTEYLNNQIHYSFRFSEKMPQTEFENIGLILTEKELHHATYAASLQIVQGVISLHQGQFLYSNDETNGLCFTIALPT